MLTSDTNMYALNGQTGAIVWTFAAQDIIASQPIVGIDQNGGVLIFGSDDGNVYALRDKE